MQDTPDEKPKKVIAKQVITLKRKYFSPTRGEVEAETLEDAVSQVQALEAEETNTKEEKVGDAR